MSGFHVPNEWLRLLRWDCDETAPVKVGGVWRAKPRWRSVLRVIIRDAMRNYPRNMGRILFIDVSLALRFRRMLP